MSEPKLGIYKCGCDVVYIAHDDSFDDPDEPWFPRINPKCPIHDAVYIWLGLPYPSICDITLANYSEKIQEIILGESALMEYFRPVYLNIGRKIDSHLNWIHAKFGLSLWHLIGLKDPKEQFRDLSFLQKQTISNTIQSKLYWSKNGDPHKW